MGCLLSRMGCSRLRMGCQSIWADRVRLVEARCTDLARVNAILQTRLAQVCESRNGVAISRCGTQGSADLHRVADVAVWPAPGEPSRHLLRGRLAARGFGPVFVGPCATPLCSYSSGQAPSPVPGGSVI